MGISGDAPDGLAQGVAQTRPGGSGDVRGPADDADARDAAALAGSDTDLRAVLEAWPRLTAGERAAVRLVVDGALSKRADLRPGGSP